MGLSPAQTGAVKGLVQTAPDALLMRLNAALSAARTSDPVFAPVSDIARAEAEDRRARDIVLEPLKPLSAPQSAPKQALLTPADITRIWRVMRATDADNTFAATRIALSLRRHETAPATFDGVCWRAANALRNPSPHALVEAWTPSQREVLARLLKMTPVLRVAQSKLPGWVRNLNTETMAVVRLAYKDASSTANDVGPLFMDALMTYLEEPSQIIRLISAVMDRPSDRYLASSELAGLGERLLTDIEERVQGVRRFDPNRGFEGGTAEGASLQLATNAVKEFEQWLTLNKEGPWGARLNTQKQGLAMAAEAHMRAAEPAVAQALPLQPQRSAGSVAPRPAPRIDGFPVEALVRRAEGLLAFINETRTSAANAGFGAARGKVIEALEQRLDTYVDDLVERLRGSDCTDPEWVRAHLEVAADFFGMIKGPKAAQIVRRRVAAG
jgi:hypothetical protein